MKKFRIIGLILLLSTFLLADSVMIVTLDKNGKGIIQKVKDKTIHDLVVLYGFTKDPPKDTTALILQEGKRARWTNATQEELEKLYDVEVYEEEEQIGHSANNNIPPPDEKDKEIKLPEELKNPEKQPEKEPEEPSEEPSSSEVEPLDGIWKSVFESTNMTGCSAMMQSMLKKFTPPSAEKKLTFSKPFNPNTDFMDKQFQWTKIRTNEWKGKMYSSGQMPQGMAMNGTMVLGVLSKKKMSIQLDQVIKLPEQIAKMMGSSTTCTVVTKGHYIKIK